MIQNILNKIEEWAFLLASPEKIVKQLGLIEPMESFLYQNKLFKVVLVDINKENYTVTYTCQNTEDKHEFLHISALLYQPDNLKYLLLRR